MLECDDISVAFDGRNVISNVSLRVNYGDRIALIGPSGSGKTTLLRVLVGLLKPNTGIVKLGTLMICDATSEWKESVPESSIWPRMTIVFQELHLFPNLTGFDNCTIGTSSMKIDDINTKITHMAKLLDVHHCLERKPRQMSHGQRQRIAIIRSLIREPEIIFLDEPTSAVDRSVRRKLTEILIKINNTNGMAIVVATHDLSFASKVANSFWVIMDHGVKPYSNFNDAVKYYSE